MKYPSTKRLSNLKDPSPWFSWTNWHFSEKLDGTCVQVWLQHHETQILTRSGYKLTGSLENCIKNQLPPQEKIQELLGNHAEVLIFGEAFGHGVQGVIGQEYGPLRYNAFAVQADGVWWNVAAEQWFVKEIGLEFVPEIEHLDVGNRATLQDITEWVARGIPSTFAPTKLVEGIIARPRQTLLWPDGSRVLFKLKSEEYYKGDPQNVMDLNFRRTKKDNRS